MQRTSFAAEQSRVVRKDHISEQELTEFVVGSAMRRERLNSLPSEHVRRNTPSSDALKAKDCSCSEGEEEEGGG